MIMVWEQKLMVIMSSLEILAIGLELLVVER